MNYLFDTYVLIYYFNGSLSIGVFEKISILLQESFSVSVISKMEFLGFKGFSIKEREKAREFLSYAEIIPLGNQIVEQVINFKQNFNIKLPDAIIAATAITQNHSLVTRNVQDFKNIDLNIINPFQSQI